MNLSGPHHKGGIGSQFAPIQKQVARLFNDTSASLITTFFDFYRWPQDAPGRATMPQGTPHQQVEHLEHAWFAHMQSQNLVRSQRFVPYLALHEFEAMLFTSPAAVAERLDCSVQEVEGERKAFANPEVINSDNPPSKRLLKIAPAYQKSVDGPTIAGKISIDTIRNACPHFNHWLDTLLAHRPS